MSEPIVAFSNEELDRLPVVKAGEWVACRHDGGEHQLYATQPDSSLLFVRCGHETYLAAVNGLLVLEGRDA